MLREELLSAMDVNRAAAEEQSKPEELVKALFSGKQQENSGKQGF